MPKVVKKSGEEEKVQMKLEVESAEKVAGAEVAKGSVKEVTTAESAPAQVEEVEDPVVDHLVKDLGALTARKVSDDKRNMSFYVALVIRNKRIVPAVVRANSKTGYVRSLIPIDKIHIEPVFKGLLEIVKEIPKYEEQMKEKLEAIERERRLKRLISRLKKEGYTKEEIQKILESS